MSVAEVRACSTSDMTKLKQEFVRSEKDGHDSNKNFIRQEIGRDSFLSFSRTGESSVQCIPLLHALDQQGSSKCYNGTKVDNSVEGKELGLDLFNGVSSFPSEMNVVKDPVHSLKSSGLPAKGTKSTSQQIQALHIPEAVVAFVQAAARANGEPEKYLPGWPLLSPSKLQLQKCEKCTREFCSTINYRRHKRVHRRSFNIDKDSPKNRELLAAFWDKLSLDDAKEILSFKNVAIEEVTGSSVIRALSSMIRKPGLFSLPEPYVKAGMTLLDVVQARPYRLPISSQELFNVLDDASEKTFLCAGTAQATQKFVFDGETGKIALDMRNLIACTSFMLEQKLVKAWLADKDEEALRCQKLLVEEEEAAQKRQAEILKRKRLKKLRQKGLKEMENKAGYQAGSSETVEGTSGSAGIPSPCSPSESDSNTPEASLNQDHLFLEPAGTSNHDLEASMRLHLHTKDADRDADHRLQMGHLAASLRLQFNTEDADPNVDHQLQVGRGQPPPIAARWTSSDPTRNTARNGCRSVQVPVVKDPVSMKHDSYGYRQKVSNAHRIWARKTKPENEQKGANNRDKAEREHREQEHYEVLIGSINVRLRVANGQCQDIESWGRNDFQQKPAKTDHIPSSVDRATAVKLWKPVGRHHSGDSAAVPSENKTEGRYAEAAENDLHDKTCPAGVVDDDCSEGRMGSSVALESGDFSGSILFSSKVAEAFLAKRWKEAIASEHVVLGLNPEETESPDCSGSSVRGSWSPNFAKVEKSYRQKYVPKPAEK